MAKQETITLCAVGDVAHMQEEDPETLFDLTRLILRGADIVFCQLEDILSERVDPAYCWVLAKNSAKAGKALANAGFNVISAAGNHHMNAGVEAFVDTLNVLKQNNILPVGVGMNIAEARIPVIVERKGTKVAFLGYSSAIPRCEVPWEARPNRPGCVPMFISTFYEPIDYQPGMPPKIVTIALKEDLAAMKEDIRRAKALADVVVMSIHWGLHHLPATIAMYEYEVGHAAIDAGVDLILGTGPHLVKGIEVYKGKVIFHSLGNFIAGNAAMPGLRGYWEEVRHDTPSMYAGGVGEIEGIVTKCIISGKKIERVSFQPNIINEAHQPELLFGNDKRSADSFKYVEWACKEAGMNTRFSREGDEMVVLT